MKLFGKPVWSDMLTPKFWDVPPEKDAASGEDIIGGDKKLPILDAIKDPFAYAMSELNLALNEADPNTDNSIPQDSPSEAIQQHKEFGEFMKP